GNLGSGPVAQPPPPARPTAPATTPSALGVELRDQGGRGALVTGVRAGGAPDRMLAPRDGIIEMNPKPGPRSRDVARELASGSGPLLFRVIRNGVSRYVAIDRNQPK